MVAIPALDLSAVQETESWKMLPGARPTSQPPSTPQLNRPDRSTTSITGTFPTPPTETATTSTGTITTSTGITITLTEKPPTAAAISITTAMEITILTTTIKGTSPSSPSPWFSPPGRLASPLCPREALPEPRSLETIARQWGSFKAMLSVGSKIVLAKHANLILEIPRPGANNSQAFDPLRPLPAAWTTKTSLALAAAPGTRWKSASMSVPLFQPGSLAHA